MHTFMMGIQKQQFDEQYALEKQLICSGDNFELITAFEEGGRGNVCTSYKEGGAMSRNRTGRRGGLSPRPPPIPQQPHLSIIRVLLSQGG